MTDAYEHNWHECMTAAYHADTALGLTVERMDITVDVDRAHIRLSHPQNADFWVELQLYPTGWHARGPVVPTPCVYPRANAAGKQAGQMLRKALIEHRLLTPLKG